MNLYKITGTKVLLFLILAVTFGFANNCRSNADDKRDGITDAEAVRQAKSVLAIRYAEGDRAESVTQDVTLPTTGMNDNGEGGRVTISWESDNSAVINLPPPPPPPDLST